jgi:hypothetical protein
MGHGKMLRVASVLLFSLTVSVLGADDFAERVKADTEWLTAFGTRQLGTPAHARLQNELLATIEAISNVTVWTHEFPVVVPVHQQTILEVDDGGFAGTHDILPIWPDVSRLNTTPQTGIRGRLIYIGKAEYRSIPAAGLKGNIAVMEMSAFADYRNAFDFGAAAVIFLEDEEPGESLFSPNQSLYKPRYYVPAGALCDALRNGEIAEGRIFSKGAWTKVMARNIYAAVKPSGLSTADVPYAVVAPYDSMSRVIGLAPGADAALDAATVLNLLRDEAPNPQRPLIFGFVDAYHINQLGMRHMAAMLTVTPDGRTRMQHDEIETGHLKDYQEAADELARFSSVEEGLSSLHDRYAAKHIRRLFKDAVGPELLRLKKLQGELRLASKRIENENTPEVREEILLVLSDACAWMRANHSQELRIDEVDDITRAEAFVLAEKRRQMAIESGDTSSPDKWDAFETGKAHAAKLLAIYKAPLRSRNHILEAVYTEDMQVETNDLPVAHLLWARMTERIEGQLEVQKQRMAFFEPLDALRGELATFFELGGDRLNTAVCHFLVGIDLSDCGVLVGPGTTCSYNRIDISNRDLTRAMRFAVKRGEIWPEDSDSRRVVNIDAIAGREGAQGWIGERALITSVGKSFGLDGLTWITDDAPRQLADSPRDRFDQLDWSRIDPQFAATRQFLDWLFTTPAFSPDFKPLKEFGAKWRHGMGRVVGVSAGETVPRVPKPGFLVTFTGAGNLDGIRRQEFTWTDQDGSFRLPLLCANVYRYQTTLNMVAYRVDDTGRFTEALTTTESLVSTRLATTFSLSSPPGDQLPRVVTFECAELNGPSFYDVRFLEPLSSGNLLDAVRGGSPKQSSFSIGSGGQMWGVVDPEIRWQLILRAGAARIRMALLNALSGGRKQGKDLRETFQRGYRLTEPLPSIPELVSARDISLLNAWRLADFRAAGIASEKIDSIRLATQKALDAAEDAIAKEDGAGLKRAASQALANEIRAYQAVKAMGLDISRGSIFLMLMLIPFCIAMERLLFACARIGRQITAALAIFAAMTVLLWSFHPAFRISAQPLVIVMSFTILALSVVVISMVLKRFRASVREFQTTLAEGSGANMGRGGVLGSAVFLGIANMRKRKVRTFLTATTIVLVTFALLCFSSTSSYVDKKDFKLDDIQAPHPAVLIRRPTFGRLDWQAEIAVKNLLGNMHVAVGERAWLGGDRGNVNWRLNLINPATGEQAPMKGALGLPTIENQLTGVDRVLDNWDRFVEQGGCYLPTDIAETLSVSVGDKVVLRGQGLTVQGIFDPIRLEEEVRLLDGQRIMPYDYTLLEQDWSNHDAQELVEQESSSSAAMQPSADNLDELIPARALIIVPTSVLRTIGGDLRSLGIACETVEQATSVANELMKTIVYPAYYSNKDGGVSVVVATPLVAVPPKNLAIPLIIAALIIFTTMLNSVSERKKEIYVYTSLGLAPTHVGALFVAEALTYGLMGAVFGYIAGQGTATVLTNLGWMQGITLNYSGTAVIKTMLLVQGVVVLSAIVPAIAAGRIAAPSTDMDWKVPRPENGVIRDALPFTVSPSAAAGLTAFMYEYLEAHRDGVLGAFDVDQIRLLARGTDGLLAGLETRLWLEPFDMGVRQKMRFAVDAPEDGVCAIHVEITHEAGTPTMWWRLNKPFFMDLRRQLLGWRKLSSERIQKYLAQAESQMQGLSESKG